MSDEQQEATLDTGNSAETQENWEQRAKEQQAGFTKSQQELAAERAVWDDEETALARFREKFPHLIVDDDEEDEPEFETPDEDRPLTRSEFEAWKRDQAQNEQQRSAQQQYEADLKTFLNGREVSAIGERAIRAAQVKNAEELKAAVDEVLEYENSRAKPKPRIPHVPTNGQAATDVPNWDDMTPGEINKYMAEQVRGHQAQT